VWAPKPIGASLEKICLAHAGILIPDPPALRQSLYQQRYLSCQPD